jgi:hypothetical protein
LDAPAVEERVGRDEQGFCPVARDSGEGRLNLPAGTGVEDLNLQKQAASIARLPREVLLQSADFENFDGAVKAFEA